jgi:hypothetical protein
LRYDSYGLTIGAIDYHSMSLLSTPGGFTCSILHGSAIFHSHGECSGPSLGGGQQLDLPSSPEGRRPVPGSCLLDIVAVGVLGAVILDELRDESGSLRSGKSILSRQPTYRSAVLLPIHQCVHCSVKVPLL